MRTIKSLAAVLIAINLLGPSHADEAVSAKTNYGEVVAAINETMRANHYDPTELDTPEYRRIEAAVAALASNATSNEAFVEGFREIWKDGP